MAEFRIKIYKDIVVDVPEHIAERLQEAIDTGDEEEVKWLAQEYDTIEATVKDFEVSSIEPL